MRDLWIRRIFVLLLGGVIGNYTPEPARLFVLGIFALLILRIWFWRPQDLFGPSYRLEILIISSGLFVGSVYGMIGHLGLEQPLTINRIQVIGELKDWTITPEEAIGTFKIEELPSGLSEGDTSQLNFAEKRYRLKVYPTTEGNLPEGWRKVRPGDILRFTGKLEQPKAPGTPGQFDLPLYYAVRGLSGGLTAQGAVEVLSAGTAPLNWRVRTHVHEMLELFPSAYLGLLEGILFGDTSRIPEEDLERYRITGVYHVFSASGSNVVFLLVLCWGLLRFLPPFLRVGISISVLVFYAFLCGGNPPILRATVMGVLALLGKLDSGKSNSLRGLLLAALFLFAWEPLILKDIGFQLSFMATWGIIVLNPQLLKIKAISRWPQALKVAFATTSSAQIATLPLLIAAFHRLSFIGLFANLVVLFILGSIFEIGILGVLFSFIPFVALPLFQVSLWLLSVVSEILFLLARISGADAWVINPGTLFWICWYGGILLSLVSRKRVFFTLSVWVFNARRSLDPFMEYIKPFLESFKPVSPTRKLSCLGRLKNKKVQAESLVRWGKRIGIKGEQILGVLLFLFLLWSPWNKPRVLEVTFIDVGQGDSILIETPKGSRILVDTGPKSERFDAGERIIVPFLLEKGIKNLDVLILTHSHADHAGGAAAVLGTFPVDWVGVPEDGEDWVNEGLNAGEEQDTLSSLWEEGGLDKELKRMLEKKPIEKLKAGDKMIFDSEIILEVLAPGEILTGTHSDENNNSLVLKLENQAGQSVLLTGDMEAEEIAELLESGHDFSADLLKVPHHGSRFSLDTDWLDRIEPQAVIVPVGKNSFGHPAPSVLRYWEERLIPVYRTDRDGTIRVRLDEQRIEVILGRKS